MANWVFLNDHFIEEEKAVLHYSDLSFQRGYGVFDFFRLVDDRPLFLNDHLDRFSRSAAGMHLPLPFSRTDIETAVLDLVRKNNRSNTGIRLSLTGGYSEDGFNIGKPNFLISQHNIMPPTPAQVQAGIRLFSYPYQRPLPLIKSIDYQMAIWLQPQRIATGADDILYHQNSLVSECPRSNFFLVTADDVLVTPADNALPGITRQKVLELAKAHLKTEVRPVALSELLSAKEAFITSTTKQILPVAAIDGRTLPKQEVSQHLLGLFRSACINN